MWKGIMKVLTVFMLMAALFGAFDTVADSDDGLSFDIVPEASASLDPDDDEGDDGGGDGGTCPNGEMGCSSS